MRCVRCVILLLAVVAQNYAREAPAGPRSLAWDRLSPLPPAPGETRQPGVASPFVGTHAGVLIVAGGANFPDRMPWDGGAKVWTDAIWILARIPGGEARWMDRAFKLPRPIGYGASVSTEEGVLCIGGSDANHCYADVFLLSWDAGRQELARTMLASLPEPLANMAAARVGSTVIVAGGQHAMQGGQPTNVCWAFDVSPGLRATGLQRRWTNLPAWPGPARVLAVAASTTGAGEASFFLFGGRMPGAGKPTTILTDAYAFEPVSQRWRQLGAVGGGNGVSVMAGTAAAIGEEIFIFGGDRGDVFQELENLDRSIELSRKTLVAASTAERAAVQREIDAALEVKRRIYLSHPGFSREVVAYNSRRDRWRVVATAPVPLPVTTTAVAWQGDVVIPSGEVRPGVRTPEILRVRSRH